MSGERPPRLRLFDILDSIRQIEAALIGESYETLRAQAVKYRAVERWLEIISEASRHVDEEWRAREPHIEWRQIANFGNVLRHGYEIVDPRIIWNIVTYDLPLLKQAAVKLYAAVKRPTDPWPDAESK